MGGSLNGLGENGAGLGATQRRVLLMLCQSRQTVNELAAALELTDNAVRAQLDRLAAAGWVRQAGMRPGVRRPHVEYELTDAAAALFPKVYEPVLRALVDVLGERVSAEERQQMLLEAGRRLLGPRVGDIGEREPAAWFRAALARLGGAATGFEVVDQAAGGEQAVVRTCACPLADVTRAHPELCPLVAQVLSELSGMEVREQCVREGAPRCAFEVRRADGGDRAGPGAPSAGTNEPER